MLIGSGCTKMVLPETNSNIYDCPAEPKLPEIQTDYEFVVWVEEMRVAGEKCRTTLQIIRNIKK